MPILEMHLLEGRSVEMKRKSIAAVTEALVETLKVRSDQVRILITEHSEEHFAVGGVSIGERNNGAGK